MQEDTATWQLLMNALSFSSISNPVLGNPRGPLTKPQWSVWFRAWKDFSLCSRVWCPPNLLFPKGFSSMATYSSKNCVKFLISLGSIRESTDSENPTSQGKSERSTHGKKSMINKSRKINTWVKWTTEMN